MWHSKPEHRRQRAKTRERTLQMAALAAAAMTALWSHAAMAQVPSSLLPRNLSPWGMFLNADIVVKAVMVGLAFASLVTWTVWLAKTIELKREGGRARRRLRMLE